MDNINMKGTIVEFCDLNEEAQRKLYEKQGATLAEEAIKSKYVSIRLIAIKDLSLGSEQLDKLFEKELSNSEEKMIRYIYDHPNFKKTDEKRRRLLKAEKSEIRKIAICDKETTSEFLNELLLEDLKNGKDEYLRNIYSFKENPNFEMNEEVSIAIIKNTERISEITDMAENPKTSSRILNEIIRKWVDESFSLIIDYALRNPSLELEKETVIALSNSKEVHYRVIAAESELNPEDNLKKMLETETENGLFDVLIERIMSNQNLPKTESLKILAKSPCLRYRKIAAQSQDTPTEELETMYMMEADEYIQKCIVKNLSSRIETSKLNFVQKYNIFLLLLKLRNGKIPTIFCLKKILDIIS